MSCYTLNWQFRYLKYQDGVARGLVEPSKLPPSEDAAHQHSLRVYLQTSIWKSLDVFCLDPCEWGWAMVNNVYEPVALSIECAPDQLLKFVRCKCKSGCSSNLCSCRKHGLCCVPSCKHCCGSCDNSGVIIGNISSIIIKW